MVRQYYQSQPASFTIRGIVTKRAVYPESETPNHMSSGLSEVTCSTSSMMLAASTKRWSKMQNIWRTRTMHSSAVQYVVVLQAAGLQMAPQFSMLRHMTKAGAFLVIHTRVYRLGTRALMQQSNKACTSDRALRGLHTATWNIAVTEPSQHQLQPATPLTVPHVLLLSFPALHDRDAGPPPAPSHSGRFRPSTTSMRANALF